MSDECPTPKSRRLRTFSKGRPKTVNRGIERASKVADTPEDPIHSQHLSAADTFEDEVRVEMPTKSTETQLHRHHHDDTTTRNNPFEDTIYRNSDTAEASSDDSDQHPSHLAPTKTPQQPSNVSHRSRVVRDKINAITENHGKDFDPVKYPRILTPNNGRLSIVEESSLRPSSSGSNLIASSLDSAPAASTSKLTPQKLFDEYCAYQKLYIHAKSSWFEESAKWCTLSGQAEKAQTYRSKIKELHNDGINRQKIVEVWCQKFSKFNILLVLGKIEGMQEEIADIIIERKQLRQKIRVLKLKKNGQTSVK
uniref:ECM11 domain-containing protein n=1 Tax=Panagrellus redivivus TaxID=6233 RepID=A0A7E5A0Y2_PANRE